MKNACKHLLNTWQLWLIKCTRIPFISATAWEYTNHLVTLSCYVYQKVNTSRYNNNWKRATQFYVCCWLLKVTNENVTATRITTTTLKATTTIGRSTLTTIWTTHKNSHDKLLLGDVVTTSSAMKLENGK